MGGLDRQNKYAAEGGLFFKESIEFLVGFFQDFGVRYGDHGWGGVSTDKYNLRFGFSQKN